MKIKTKIKAGRGNFIVVQNKIAKGPIGRISISPVPVPGS